MISSQHNDLGSPAILIVQDSQAKLKTDSIVVNSFEQVYKSITNSSNTLLWIQQNQPDLIILNLDWSKVTEFSLIAALKLDWLTRDIPVLAIIDRFQAVNLDCDACLTKPYSTAELEKAICSLVSTPVCLCCAG